MSIQLRIYDLVKLRDGRVGIIHNRKVTEDKEELCVYLQPTESQAYSEEIPLEYYFMDSFFFDARSTQDKGNDPRDIIAIKRGDRMDLFIYYHGGMDYYSGDDEPKWDWKAKTSNKKE